MVLDLAIRGAAVARPEGVEVLDVGVLGGRIEAVGAVGPARAEVDATGKHLLPGVIDTQVHFREPGATHKEDLGTGTLAALCGGVTCVFEMPNTSPPTTSEAALADKLDRAQGRAWCDYAFFVGASRDNVDRLPDLERLPGTPGIKVFMGSSTGPLLIPDEETLARVLAAGERRVSVHAEDEARLRARRALADPELGVAQHPFLRDAEAAMLATERLLRLAEATGRPVHVLHVSTAEEPAMIRTARARGVDATAEVTPQHLALAAPEAYERLGTLAQMNPPIREARHRDALRAALAEGFFDVFGSDHAPHTLAEKALPYLGEPGSPSGMPGVQTLLPMALSFVRAGLIALPRLVAMTSQRPAELFGISNKGRIAPGYDADFALVDLGATRRLERDALRSKCGWSPFEGLDLPDFPAAVYLRGRLAAAHGAPVGEPGGRPIAFDWKPEL